MIKSLGSFRAALLGGWVALGGAGVLYARIKNIPGWAALPVVAAFLVAYPFYLVPAFREWRERLAGVWLGAYVVAAAVLPYLACCCGGVSFELGSFFRLLAMGLVFAIWYVVFPPAALVDLAFLVLIPTVLLGGYFQPVYVARLAGLKDLIFLGHVTLISITVMVLMRIRRVPDFGFGFVPERKAWQVGGLHFLYFVPVGLPLALLLRAAHFVRPAHLWMLPVNFLGFLWVGALSEEFFFRGVLQQWLEEWTGSRTAALLAASGSFGLVHIGFRPGFPNWRWVLIATVLGLFCGRARNLTGSIQAGMITHALVFATWRAFFA